jgi:hypothetical protein
VFNPAVKRRVDRTKNNTKSLVNLELDRRTSTPEIMAILTVFEEVIIIISLYPQRNSFSLRAFSRIRLENMEKRFLQCPLNETKVNEYTFPKKSWRKKSLGKFRGLFPFFQQLVNYGMEFESRVLNG